MDGHPSRRPLPTATARASGQQPASINEDARARLLNVRRALRAGDPIKPRPARLVIPKTCDLSPIALEGDGRHKPTRQIFHLSYR